MIHKEGIRFIIPAFIILAIVNSIILFVFSMGLAVQIIVVAGSILVILFLCLFFRKPSRNFIPDENILYAPADGKIVAIEETDETEYFGDKRIQVSIFMSIWNVHINWYPATGKIVHYKYHPGRYLVARHPKSSLENERNTIVIESYQGRLLLVRQIAGIVARRIVSNAFAEKEIMQGDELGFIRFGSRVDVFLPPGSTILVGLGYKTKGLITSIAKFN